MSAGIYEALCRAAIARHQAFNESREIYRAHSIDQKLSQSARIEAFILSALFLSLAKAARVEAEAMRDAAQGTEARRAETGTGSVHDGPVLAEDAPTSLPTSPPKTSNPCTQGEVG